MPLRLVQTVVKPIRRIHASKPGAMLQCQCGCREVVEVRTGAELKTGRVTGGVRQWLCAECYRRGDRVVLA